MTLKKRYVIQQFTFKLCGTVRCIYLIDIQDTYKKKVFFNGVV